MQFWLEQNARMLGATIQALEVQRMTLSTLKTMNVQMADLRESLKMPQPAPAAERRGAGAAIDARAAARASGRRPTAAPAPRRRGRPDAVVGRADQAVHRAGRQAP